MGLYKTFLVLGIGAFILGFVCGAGFEYSANKVTIDDIQQVANESCDVRIKIMKQSCKR